MKMGRTGLSKPILNLKGPIQPDSYLLKPDLTLIGPLNTPRYKLSVADDF